MILYFISALLIGAVLFKLGSYWTIIHFLAVSGKAATVLLVVAGLVLIFRKLMMSRPKIRQQKLPHRHVSDTK